MNQAASPKAHIPWDNDQLGDVLRKIVAQQAEGAKFDFKQDIEHSTWDQKAELLKDITAIANSYDDNYEDFGFIIYGAKPGKICGVSTTETNTDQLQNTIDQLLRTNISPMPVVYVCGYEEPTGEKWGVLVIAPLHRKPYMFFKDISCQDPAKTRRKGEWFVRKNTTTSPGLPEDLTVIVQKQTEVLLAPLHQSVLGLQARVEKVESQYDGALFKVLTKAVSMMEGDEIPKIEKVIEATVESPKEVVSKRLKFPSSEAKDGPARFRTKGEALGFEDDMFGENGGEVFLSPGPAMWLRVMPSENPLKEWPTRELKRATLEKSYLLPLIHPAGGYSYLRASDGEGMYRASDTTRDEKTNPHRIDVKAITFAFKTGEVWSVETAMLSWAMDKLYVLEIEKSLVTGLANYANFLKDLGVPQPFHWKAGLVGVKGRHLQYPPPPGKGWLRDTGPICAADVIEAEGEYLEGQRPSTALLPFFNKIFDECGRERPDHLPQ